MKRFFVLSVLSTIFLSLLLEAHARRRPPRADDCRPGFTYACRGWGGPGNRGICRCYPDRPRGPRPIRPPRTPLPYKWNGNFIKLIDESTRLEFSTKSDRSSVQNRITVQARCHFPCQIGFDTLQIFRDEDRKPEAQMVASKYLTSTGGELPFGDTGSDGKFEYLQTNRISGVGKVLYFNFIACHMDDFTCSRIDDLVIEEDHIKKELKFHENMDKFNSIPNQKVDCLPNLFGGFSCSWEKTGEAID